MWYWIYAKTPTRQDLSEEFAIEVFLEKPIKRMADLDRIRDHLQKHFNEPVLMIVHWKRFEG